MVIFFNGSYPLRVDWMDVEIGEVDLLVFLHDRVDLKSFRVKLIHQLGLEVREYEVSVLVSCYK